jgi:hypothetical protein
MSEPEFRPFQKIPRLSRDIVITEKIDGTNGVIFIPYAVEQSLFGYGTIYAGSKSRWLNATEKGADNFGFAGWVYQNQNDLVRVLGPGYHHGEWYGRGIQRNYGLDHKRFALFNPKWKAAFDASGWMPELDVVPVLYDGPLSDHAIYRSLEVLQLGGSRVVPGFMNPEGVVIFHTASRHLYKKTILGDEKPKGSAE